MESRTLPPEPAPGNRRRARRRLTLALTGIAAAALLSLGELTARPAVAQDGFCPVNLEQSDPCGGTGDGTDAGSAEAPPLPSVTLGNPVSLVTGAKRQRETDFALDGAPLAFHRHYDSAGTDVNVGLGPGWRHGLSVALFSRPDGGREIIESAGRRVLFDRVAHEDAERTADVPIGRVRYRARLPSDGVVVEEAGFHTWHLPDGRTLRFQGSYLVRIDWPASASVAGGAPRSLSLYYRQRRLASVTDEAGRVLRLEYTPNRSVLRDFDGPRGQPRAGHLAALVLPDGRRVAYGYDARGNLAEAHFDDGTARTYHYEDPIWPHHLTGLTERTGTRLASWTYDERGRAVSSEHAGGVERVGLAFDAPVDRGETVGRTGTTTVTDSLGARSVYTWRRHPRSGASLLLSASGPGCATCPPTGRRYTYTEDARLATATRLDDHGNPLVERRYTWTDDGRLAALHEWTAGGAERLLERREYAPGIARPVLVARPSVNGSGEHTVETTFDADGVPVSITERGHAPTVEPEALGFAGTGTQERSRASGTPSAFRAIERTTRFAYADGRLTTIDGPREDVDDVTRLEWHADIPSRLVAIHPPASPPIRLVEHDALGRPSAFRLGSASPWRVERDVRGDVMRLTHRELVVTYTRDAEGRVTAIADTDGRTLHLEHDAAGRPERMIDDLGRVTRWLSDTEGRVTERTLYGFDGSLVQSIERLHDAHGRLTTEHESRAGPDGTPTTRRTTFEHDAAGRLVAAEDATSGARRTLAVDPLARLMTLTEPDGATTAIELDANGRERALTDARENRTVTWRDDFGRVVLLDSPDTGTTVTEHDAAGNAVRRTHENGSVTTFAHDAAGRLVARDDVDGHTTWTYGDGGDGAGGANTNGATAAGAHGRLIATSNATTTERFAYDVEGQLVRHARELGGHTFTTRYTRDGRGRLVDKHLPDGQTLRHHYHEAGPDRGRLRAITRGRWFGLASETLVAEIDLDARDGSSGHLTHGGLSTRRRFTPTGELESIEIGQTLRLDYRFDTAGRIVGIEENGAARRYDYTGGRLTRALTANATYTYRHDALGNRLARTVEDASGARTERYRYAERGQGNRLLDVVDESTGRETAYDYGADGAPRRIGQLGYTYDAHRRPITLSRSGRLVARYAYNPFGERVSKILYPAGGGEPRTTHFLYDGSTLVAEIDGTDDEGAKVTAQYVYLDGHRAVAKLEGRRAYAIHGDQLGTPLMMTDADGEIVWRAEHTPFGETRIGIEKVRLDLRLPGQYADAESGTHYNYFRDYDPGTGRYVTSDPIGLAGGANTYAYALADPLGRSDPLGLDSLTLSGGLTLSGPGPEGIHALLSDAVERGTITEEQFQQSYEGLINVPKPAPDSEFVDKLRTALGQTAYELRYGELTDTALADFVDSMVEGVVAVAGVMVLYSALVVTQPQIAALIAGAGFVVAGAEASAFLFDLFTFGRDLARIDACDRLGQLARGNEFAKTLYDTGLDVASGALLGAFGGVARVVRLADNLPRQLDGDSFDELRTDAGEKFDDALARADDAGTNPTRGLCSFDGDTLVRTRSGYQPIRDVEPGRDTVWARDERTGHAGWREVLARYSNRYGSTVRVTAREPDGDRQTIVSNRIHPFFARVAAGALLAVASEGHVYAGDIDGGAWVDAQHLEAGDLLLGEDDRWQTVESIEIESKPLDAFNLTVEGYSTYFVAGDSGSLAVWVHNTCLDRLPEGFQPNGRETPFGQTIFVSDDGRHLYLEADGKYYDPLTRPPRAEGHQPPSDEAVALLGNISPQIFAGRQRRHVKDTREWNDLGKKGYMDSMEDAQAVLNATRSGEAEILGVTRNGALLVRYPGVTGTNVNVSAGYPAQPTNVFMIKGTTKTSVVPVNPQSTPDR